MEIKIIISPAKKMKIDNDDFSHRQMPSFIEETTILSYYLKSLTYEELKSIWKCSDKLVKLNFDRIKKMDLHDNLTAAIISFEGLQYQYMGAEVMTTNQLDYIEDHLCILSGFYGILSPFDGIRSYRLEMESKLLDWEYKSLYEFWGDTLAKSMTSEAKCIVNLASKEYSKALVPHFSEDVELINCVFGEIKEGRVIQKATLLKMARGELVRYMAEKNIKNPEDIKNFDRLDYSYREELSDKNNYIFIKRAL